MNAVIEKTRIHGKLRRDHGVKNGLQPTHVPELAAFYVEGKPIRFFAETPLGTLVLFTDDGPSAIVALANAIGFGKKINPAINFGDGHFFFTADSPTEIGGTALARGFECDRGDSVGFAKLTFDCKGGTFSYEWLPAKTEKAARACLKQQG